MRLHVSVCVFLWVLERDERKKEGERGGKRHADSLINHETDSAVS